MADELKQVLATAGGAVGLSAIYLAGLLALWAGKSAEKTAMRELFWYAFVMLLVVLSPLGVYATMLLPVAPLVLRITAEAAQTVQKPKEKVLFTLAVGALLLLAGTSDFTPKGFELSRNAEEIPKAELEALSAVDDYLAESRKTDVLLWGKSEVVLYARKHSADIRLLYDRSLWEGLQDKQFYVPYEQWALDAYELMEEAQEDPERVGTIGERHGCDVLVLSRSGFEENAEPIPERMGRYELYRMTERYLIYVMEEADESLVDTEE